jgi:ADP-ribosyl-[dinitrogen reductase] hydrolase
MLGNDTDTTACIAGGLAGLLYGYENIPERWREVLKGKELVEKVLAKF